MMNKLGLYKHGEERNKIISVNNGKSKFIRREKFCACHGWIDVFLIGGDIAWHKQHTKCDQAEEESSNEAQTITLKLRPAAA